MGQYYRPTNIDKFESLYSHDFDNGLKLMEHSYIKNTFVKAVERLLSPKGPWHKCRLCWAGDYMEAGLFLPEGTPLKDDKGYDINLYSFAQEKTPFNDSLTPERADDDSNYKKVKAAKAVASKKWLKSLPRAGRYLVNHTKELCIDLKAEDVNERNQKGNRILAIHPLPLLTCCGNGQGGGDYLGSKMNIVGTWAGDVISLENKPMYALNIPIIFREKCDGGDVCEQYTFINSEQKISAEKLRKEISKNKKEKDEFYKSDIVELMG